MNTTQLITVLRQRANAILDTTPADHPALGTMRDDAELIHVLARIVEGKSIPKAFGAPGDWGYGTAIGKALAAAPAAGSMPAWLQPGMESVDALAKRLPPGWTLQYFGGQTLPWAILDYYPDIRVELATLADVATLLSRLPVHGCIAETCRECDGTGEVEVDGTADEMTPCPACAGGLFVGFVLTPMTGEVGP